MTAYRSMRLDDLWERKGNGEALTPKEETELNTLWEERVKEEEEAPPPWLYGGDMEDVF